MSDLATISLARIAPTADLFSNFHYHRTVILEGLRRTAYRNMRHLSLVEQRVGPPPRSASPASPPVARWVERIQAEQLRDQGLPNTALNRTLVQRATFLPVKLYFAVLYAELEFLQKHAKPRARLYDRRATEACAEHIELIQKLKLFRHGLLHPKPGISSAEAELLTAGLYKNVAILQTELDQSINRIRQKVRHGLDRVLDELPDAQVLICKYMHLKECSEHPIFIQHAGNITSLTDELQAIADRLQQPASRNALSEPSSRQVDHARQISQWLTSTSALRTVGDFPDHDTFQPPMEPSLSRPLDPPTQRAELKLTGRTASHISAQWGGYVSLMLTAGVLLNETRQSQRMLSVHAIDQGATSQFVSTLTEAAPSEFVRLAALGRVTTALLVPPLDMYRRVRQENPEFTIAYIDAIAADPERMSALRDFRNSVFHVQNASDSGERLDSTLLDLNPANDMIDVIYAGIAEFLSCVQPNDPAC